MIIREILEDTSIINRFDYFNDYNDTTGFIQMQLKALEKRNICSGEECFLQGVLFDLEIGYDEWCKKKGS